MSFFKAREHGLDPKQRPNMQLINMHIIRQYAAYWESTGENLGIQHLEVIKLNKQGHPSFNEECFRDMLKKWLQIDVNASWEKLQNAINQAIRNAIGTMPEDITAVPGPSEDSRVHIKTEGYDTSRPKEVKRKHDEDEDNVRATSSVSVNPTKISTGRRTQETGMEYATSAKCAKLEPDDEIDGDDQVGTGNQADFIPKHPSGYDDKDIEMKPNQGDGVPSKSSDSTSTELSTAAASDSGAEMTDYSKISKAMPAYAVIINNKEFDKSRKREGSDKDEKSIKGLKSLNVSVKHALKDLTADEMVGALKFLATKDPDNLSSVANGRGALKLLNTAEGKMNKFDTIEKIRGGLICTDDLESFEGYSCLMVFIMTHGSNNGILAGRDSSETTVDKLAEVFNSEQCKELAGKPKIFIIQACRGGDVDEMKADDDKLEDSKDDQISCALPKEADFLYVYAIPKGYKALRHPTKGSPFIQTLVDVLLQTRKHNCHLEESLLSVKHKIAKDQFKFEGKKVKMMPSVVSQMRGKIEFDLSSA